MTLADLVLAPSLLAGAALPAGSATAMTALPTLPTPERASTAARAPASTERSAPKPITTGA